MAFSSLRCRVQGFPMLSYIDVYTRLDIINVSITFFNICSCFLFDFQHYGKRNLHRLGWRGSLNARKIHIYRESVEGLGSRVIRLHAYYISQVGRLLLYLIDVLHDGGKHNVGRILSRNPGETHDYPQNVNKPSNAPFLPFKTCSNMLV